MAKYLLEAQEPANGVWAQLMPPDWWSKTEHGPDDDLFDAPSPRAALRSWLDAYPKYGQAPGKPYLAFRSTKIDGRRRRFRITEIGVEEPPEPVFA